MSVRSEREKSKMQEKYQMILAQMLKEDDNRFCVDCDTKSPRWASWNLGIFICIRCAGFHRNLGVHISKVKSVNLDSWTAEQIASMQAMGNNRARAVYEANMPSGFRRPQTDAALEAFIRSKYEQRKWIAKEWIPPEITVSSDLIESETNQRRNETPVDRAQNEKTNDNKIPKIKPIGATGIAANPVRQPINERPAQNIQATIVPTPKPQPVNIENPPDLLGLDEPSVPIPSDSQTKMTNAQDAFLNDTMDPLRGLFTVPAQNTNAHVTSTSNFNTDLEAAFSSANTNISSTNSNNLMTTDKIMALYNTQQTSMATGMNIRPTTMQQPNVNPSGFLRPQIPQQNLAHQKSASYGSNLYQHANTNFGSQTGFSAQSGFQIQPRPGIAPINHNNPNNMSLPTLQMPATSTSTQDQLTDHFSQFVPFANSLTNPSASVLISNMPTRPVTEYMPASSDLLWQ